MIPTEIPDVRIKVLKDVAPNAAGQYVLYWMTAFRRTEWNYALQRAAWWSEHLQKPLLIFEPLRVGYRWASDRLHQFIVDGMRDNAASLRNKKVTYYPYLEKQQGEGAGLIEALAAQAAVVVGDEYPCFFLKHLPTWFAKRTPCRFEVVDSNCLMPLRTTDKIFTVAHSYRRFMQKQVALLLKQRPLDKPLESFKLPAPQPIPAEITRHWPAAAEVVEQRTYDWSSFDIDHSVKPTDTTGGRREALRRWQQFIEQRITLYNEDRNHPDKEGSSTLSPHLHFGHISAHEMFFGLLEHKNFREEQLVRPNGKVNGFWNFDAPTEAFLDQLLTWREIGFNQCYLDRHYDSYRSLPTWVRNSLGKHANDKREHLYSLAEFEQALTHDPLWNAAQRQLVRDGIMHNYLRMLWGKKILHWSRNAEEALAIMIELNNKYALDGRDPNSYSGIFWVLGRYDRPWGPEREIFGSIRYMTSDSTLKKVRVKKYLEKYGGKAKV
jgi:deoxyribodipyrimidine photo-lyase